MFVAPIVSMAHISDSTTIATDSRRQKATKGASALEALVAMRLEGVATPAPDPRYAPDGGDDHQVVLLRRGSPRA